jgi:very-short-patch-repair endonuclease
MKNNNASCRSLSRRERVGVRGHNNSQALMTERARDLRKAQTDTEYKMWQLLRNRQLSDAKFRRQYLVGPYIVDFICLAHGLVIELDGSQHVEQAAYDKERSQFLNTQGFTVLRFWNNEVLQQGESVLEIIRQHITTPPSPQPSPGGRGSGNLH